MRMTTLATVVSSILLGTAVAHAGDKMGHEKFTAADKDGDGSLTLSEAQADPKLAEKFAAVDANSDGKITSEEWKTYSDKAMEADETTTPKDK